MHPCTIPPQLIWAGVACNDPDCDVHGRERQTIEETDVSDLGSVLPDLVKDEDDLPDTGM